MFLNFRDAAVWSYLIDNAAWADGTDIRFQGVRFMLNAGQIMTSERFLAEGFSCDRQVVRRIFEALEKDQMITRERTRDATIITICNYKRYQGFEEDGKPIEPAEKTQREPTENPNINTSNEGKKESDVVVSRECLREVGDKVLKLCRADEDPSCRLNASLVEVWLKRDFDPDLDIYPTIERIMAKRAQGPPTSLSYFDKAIAQAFADRTRTIADEAPNVHRFSPPKPAKHTQESDRAAILAGLNLDAGNGGMVAEPGGAGDTIEGDYRRSH